MPIFHGFMPMDTTEKKVVELITTFKHSSEKIPDTTLFSNLLFDPLGHDGIEEYNGYYVATNVLREEMQLNRHGRPGDFDILFIPYNQRKLFYDRSAVFEVKIARPYFEKPNKSTNSLGETQIKGLIEDGFPLVGLLHVCIPLPLEEDQTSWIKVGKHPLNMDWKPGDPPQPSAFKEFEYHRMDWLPWHAVNTQMKRLISAGFPKYIGINAFGLTRNEDGTHNVVTSMEYRGYTSGYFNPRKQEKTIRCIEAHFLKYGIERYRKLEIWDRDKKT